LGPSGTCVTVLLMLSISGNSIGYAI